MSERDESDAGPSDGDDAESSTDAEEHTPPDDSTSTSSDDASESDPILDLDDASSDDEPSPKNDSASNETVLTDETEDGSDGSTETDPDGTVESDERTETEADRSTGATEQQATQDETESATATPDRSSPQSDVLESDSGTVESELDGSDAHPDTSPTESEEIDPAELTIPLRSLDPRVRYLWTLKSAISAGFAGAIAAVVDAFVLGVGPMVPLAIGTSLFVLGAIHAVLRYRVWRYEVREDALYLERGVLTRVKTVVPFVRIQHVDTSRGPVERATGLATSVVYTAGSRGADVTVPGLTVDRAEDMQHRLKRLAIAAEDDTTV